MEAKSNASSRELQQARLPSIALGAPHSAAFSLELNPVNPLELVVVEELARRAAQMEELEAARQSLKRQGQAAFADIAAPAGEPSLSALDVANCGILGSERHAALLRQGLAAAGGFFRALREFRELRAPSQSCSDNEFLPDPRFTSERACCVYLVRRYVNGICSCPRCGGVSSGCFVAARKCWQCSGCGAQSGIRIGTCMEHSAVPLVTWFTAIRNVLLRPSIQVSDLAAVLRISRRQTVRGMANKIRVAASSKNASQFLAGLDQLYLGFD